MGGAYFKMYMSDRALAVNTAHEHTCTTFLELLLHMYDVPRKVIYSAGECKEIQDFYPTEQNYRILLYNDTDNKRLEHQKNAENKKMLSQCAIYLFIDPTDDGKVVVDERVLNLHKDLTALKTMLHARTIAGYRTLHEALRQLIELA